jgi:hypothetical protein
MTGPAVGLGATAMIVALVVAVGPTGSDDSDSAGGGEASVAIESAPNAGAASEEAAGGGASARSADDSAESLAAPVPPSAPAPGQGAPGTDGRNNRKVERSASLRLAAPPREIDQVSAEIQEVTRRQGGFVVTSSVSSSRTGGRGTFTLRIPTRNLDAAIADLSRLAAVREREQHAEDITAQSVSARSRLRDAKTERKSLLTQLGEADTVQETAAIRARLRLVSAEIEQARADVRRVNNRASFATVTVALVADRDATTKGDEDDSGAWTPADAWDDAVRVLEVIAGVALIVFAVALPLALVALLIGLALRLGRRRSREHALDAV